MKAFGARDPLTTRQKALTPTMLKDLQSVAKKMGHRDKAHRRPHRRRLLLCNEGLRVLEGVSCREDKAANSREHQVPQPKGENAGTRKRRS